LIAPVYFSTVPLLGILSSVLSRKIKVIQKQIVAETTALAGSTTESLRNIELVKSLGLAQQEIGRLNATTTKILALELRKVRYLRSLSFIQGTAVNFLRTSILFLMLYLIFAQQITVGQFFSLFIYSFFIFGPLQELGNVINTYRETEASLANFETILRMPKERRPLEPVPLGPLTRLEFDRVGFQHQTATTPALIDISFQATRGEDNAGEAAGGAVHAENGTDSLQRRAEFRRRARSASRAHRLRDTGHSALLGNHSRKPALRESGRERRRMPGGAAPGRVRQPAGAGAEGAGHRYRRGRCQGVGR
jgi:ATP-binding cassette subfamily B protein